MDTNTERTLIRRLVRSSCAHILFLNKAIARNEPTLQKELIEHFKSTFAFDMSDSLREEAVETMKAVIREEYNEDDRTNQYLIYECLKEGLFFLK